jgi:lipoate-protein ligase A
MKADYKIPGGKLVTADVEVDGSRLVCAKITGDFFMHPEEAIIVLERALKGIRIAELDDVVNRFFERNQVSLFGITQGDFVKVIRMALEPGTLGVPE